MKTLKLLIIATLLIIQGASTKAHEGHSHGEKKKESPVNVREFFTVNSVSESYEAVLRYVPIKPNEETIMKLFLSDFETNVPTDSTQVKITCIEDKSIQIEVHFIEPGIYELHAVFPAEKKYQLEITLISGNHTDFILIDHIDVGNKLPIVKKENISGIDLYSVFLVLSGLIAGALLMLLIMKKKKTATMGLFLLLLLPNNLSNIAEAHGDHDNKKKKTKTAGNLYADEIKILKETQFMFNVQTKYVQKTNYYTVLKLYGKIMSSLNGEARIIIPQDGAIISLHVNIGQKVNKGQVLAIIEQNLTATELIQIENEKNNAFAEYEDAEKDYNRIKLLEGIIAGKDLLGAKIRFDNASQNKKIYDNLNGRMLSLKSPISGFVDNFNMAIGQQVVQGDHLFTVFNTKTLKVEAQIFDKDMHKLNHPDTSSIRSKYSFSVECIQEKEHFSEYARLLSFGKSVNPVNQSSQVILELDNKNELFKPGQFANVEVHAKGDQKQIVVPTSAIAYINGKPAVFVHTEPEVFKVKYIKTGEGNASRTVILKGLEEHERVVNQGAYQIKSIYLNQ